VKNKEEIVKPKITKSFEELSKMSTDEMSLEELQFYASEIRYKNTVLESQMKQLDQNLKSVYTKLRHANKIIDQLQKLFNTNLSFIMQSAKTATGAIALSVNDLQNTCLRIVNQPMTEKENDE
jgi:hypothetical protein